MYRNIIWDVDGTLFDTYPAMARSIRSALNDLGEDAPLDWIEGLAKKSLGHCVSTLADRYQLDAENIEQAFEKYYDCVTPEEQLPFPGVIKICKYICSIGGKNVIVTHRGRIGTTELLAAHNMTHYFTGSLSRDDGYPRKPDPAAFDAIINLHSMAREKTMTVGDRDIDILAGQLAGVFTCLFGRVTDGVVADLTISNFDELYRFLQCPITN